MQLTKAARQKDNPALKGNVSTADILRSEWEHNYKKIGIPVEALEAKIMQEIRNGMTPIRMRNTIMLFRPEESDPTAFYFHTITADPYEVYVTVLMLLCISLSKTRGAETMYTDITDKSTYRLAKKAFGSDFVGVMPAKSGMQLLTIDIGRFCQANTEAQEQ